MMKPIQRRMKEMLVRNMRQQTLLVLGQNGLRADMVSTARPASKVFLLLTVLMAAVMLVPLLLTHRVTLEHCSCIGKYIGHQAVSLGQVDQGQFVDCAQDNAGHGVMLGSQGNCLGVTAGRWPPLCHHQGRRWCP